MKKKILVVALFGMLLAGGLRSAFCMEGEYSYLSGMNEENMENMFRDMSVDQLNAFVTGLYVRPGALSADTVEMACRVASEFTFQINKETLEFEGLETACKEQDNTNGWPIGVVWEILRYVRLQYPNSDDNKAGKEVSLGDMRSEFRGVGKRYLTRSEDEAEPTVGNLVLDLWRKQRPRKVIQLFHDDLDIDKKNEFIQSNNNFDVNVDCSKVLEIGRMGTINDSMVHNIIKDWYGVQLRELNLSVDKTDQAVDGLKRITHRAGAVIISVNELRQMLERAQREARWLRFDVDEELRMATDDHNETNLIKRVASGLGSEIDKLTNNFWPGSDISEYDFTEHAKDESSQRGLKKIDLSGRGGISAEGFSKLQMPVILETDNRSDGTEVIKKLLRPTETLEQIVVNRCGQLVTNKHLITFLAKTEHKEFINVLGGRRREVLEVIKPAFNKLRYFDCGGCCKNLTPEILGENTPFPKTIEVIGMERTEVMNPGTLGDIKDELEKRFPNLKYIKLKHFVDGDRRRTIVRLNGFTESTREFEKRVFNRHIRQ